MKTTPILLLTLVAASASAASSYPGYGLDQGLNYNRVGVGYLSNDAFKGFNVTGTAELGKSGVLLSGTYSDVSGKGDFKGISGYMTGFGLAYKFDIGPGDLAVGFNYLQGQFGAVDGVAVAEQKGFGLQYRQEIGANFELLVGYQRVRTNLGALAVDELGFIDGLVTTTSVNVFNVGLRYNVTSKLDISLGYAFQAKEAGGDTLSASVGISF